MALFGLIYRAFPALAGSRLAAAHFILYNLGAVVFLAGIPLAKAGQTIALAAGGGSHPLGAAADGGEAGAGDLDQP
jgi:hypothetical protein